MVDSAHHAGGRTGSSSGAAQHPSAICRSPLTRGAAHPTLTLLLTRAFQRELCRSQESLAQVPQPHQYWRLGLRSPWVQKQDCIGAALKARLV